MSCRWRRNNFWYQIEMGQIPQEDIQRQCAEINQRESSVHVILSVLHPPGSRISRTTRCRTSIDSLPLHSWLAFSSICRSSFCSSTSSTDTMIWSVIRSCICPTSRSLWLCARGGRGVRRRGWRVSGTCKRHFLRCSKGMILRGRYR